MNFGDMFNTATKPAATPTAVNLQPTPNYAVVAVKPTLPASIEEIGRSSTSKINKISEQVLNKVKVGDTGGLGKGITDILSLTATVDMSKIDNEDPGLFGKLTNIFKQTRVKILAQYEDVNEQIGRIATSLQGELALMDQENKWLEEMYQENLVEIHKMKGEVEMLRELLTMQTAYVEHLKQQQDQSMEHAQLINDEVNNQLRLEKHIDRMERLIQIGIMDAPDIRSLQKSNQDTKGSFTDIIDVTLPLWKRQLTLSLQAHRALKRAEMGNAIADRNNELMKKRADLMHDSSIKTAQLSQRSSVADTETLEYTQNKLIDRLNQVKQIETNGRNQRSQDAQKIAANREQLRLEMQSWGN